MMGMFDYVDFSCYCPQCGSAVEGFQSKDGPCTLSTLAWSQVGNFYSTCEDCHVMLGFTQVPPRQMPTHTLTVWDGDMERISTVDIAVLSNESVRVLVADGSGEVLGHRLYLEKRQRGQIE